MMKVTDAIMLDDREVKERFVRATGPGGQNIRREATAVELRLDLGASSLPPDVKDRLMALAGRAVTTERVLVVVSRAHQSQTDNREAARARLLTLLLRAATPPKERQPTKPPRRVREARLTAKEHRRAVKQGRARNQGRED